MTHADDRLITSIEQLETLYHDPVKTSLLKELDHITDDYRQFIDASPFVVLATAGPEGLDCSPRGDPAGFVRVVDEHTVMIPDRRGNNRVDSLRNIVGDPRVALLFLIPGIGETMRINGHAVLSTDPDLCQQLRDGRQAAGMRDRDHRRPHLPAMPEGAHPIEALGSGHADPALGAAHLG